MKKNIFKKLFIKISKLVGYELIDQNEFYSPTLEKNLDEKLSNKNKSIILTFIFDRTDVYDISTFEG